MARSKCSSIDLPDSLSVRIYDGVNGKVARLTDKSRRSGVKGEKSLYQTWGSAWLGVGYRAAASVKYDAEFRVAIAEGTGPEGPARLAQERALFGFFCSVAASFDCFYMALYSIWG
jgi:hypothetical protein